MRVWFRLIVCFAALAMPAFGSAQDFPSRPIKLVVPFPAGGPNDIIGRVVGEKMAALLGQPVVIENRAGAGGVLGTNVVARAEPDGYTIALTSAGALAISSSLQEKVPYDTLKDLRPITLVAAIPELLVVGRDVPAATFAELLALAKSKPGQLNFASSGRGSMPHLAGELLRISANIDIVHVPYSGAAPAVNDLIGGHVQMMFADIPVLLPNVQAGTLKALAVGSRTRAPGLPDVPTTAELGFPQIQAVNWYGMVAPAATPQTVIAKLHGAIVQSLRAAEVREKLSSQGAILAGNTPEEFAAYIKSETQKWAGVVKASGAK